MSEGEEPEEVVGEEVAEAEGDGPDTTYTKLFVGGLPWSTRNEGLRRHFSTFGHIEEAAVIIERPSGKSKGYGFVTFEDPESAKAAINDPNPVIDGRRANCNLAAFGKKQGRTTAKTRGRRGATQRGRGGDGASVSGGSYEMVHPQYAPYMGQGQASMQPQPYQMAYGQQMYMPYGGQQMMYMMQPVMGGQMGGYQGYQGYQGGFVPALGQPVHTAQPMGQWDSSAGGVMAFAPMAPIGTMPQRKGSADIVQPAMPMPMPGGHETYDVPSASADDEWAGAQD